MDNIMEISSLTNDTYNDNGQSNSPSNQATLIQLKRSPAPKKCISFYGLSTFERCFVFLNVCIIVILLSIVFLSLHRLDNIKLEINGIKDNHLQQIKGTHVKKVF